MYPKDQVYPKEGGEVQLEQLRARLPQYCPPAQDVSPTLTGFTELYIELLCFGEFCRQ